MKSETEVAIIGGGAAGVAAGRHLHDAGIDCLIVEARNRLGGRALTETHAGFPIDLGCGWLHSADNNEWTRIAQAQGRTIDQTPPPWARSSLGFRLGEQQDYRQAFDEFEERISKLAHAGEDVAVAAALEPGGRWNGLIGAVVTYISGGEADQVSARDYENYAHTDVNWRVVEGYGATIARHGDGVPVAFDAPVRRIDHSGKRLKIETANGIDHRRSRHRHAADHRARRDGGAVRAGAAREDRSRAQPAARSRRQAVHRARQARGVRKGQPPVRRQGRQQDRRLPHPPVRPRR